MEAYDAKGAAAEIAATLGILEADLETIKAQAAWLRDRAIEIGKELVEQGDSRGTYEARLELMELHQRAAALVDLRPAHLLLRCDEFCGKRVELVYDTGFRHYWVATPEKSSGPWLDWDDAVRAYHELVDPERRDDEEDA